MKANLVAIGNSRGIRIPKPLIEQFGFEREVVLEATARGLLITTASLPRRGWEDAFRQARNRTDMAEPETAWPSTRFDREEWQW